MGVGFVKQRPASKRPVRVERYRGTPSSRISSSSRARLLVASYDAGCSAKFFLVDVIRRELGVRCRETEYEHCNDQRNAASDSGNPNCPFLLEPKRFVNRFGLRAAEGNPIGDSSTIDQNGDHSAARRGVGIAFSRSARERTAANALNPLGGTLAHQCGTLAGRDHDAVLVRQEIHDALVRARLALALGTDGGAHLD